MLKRPANQSMSSGTTEAFGLQAREPHAVLQVLEAQELHHVVALVAHGAHEAVQGLHGRVGEVVQHAAARLSRAAEGIGRPRRGHGAAARSAPAASRAVVRALGRHGVAHEAVDDGAGTRVVRERGAHDGVVGGVATDALDAALDAHGALHVRLHEAHRLPEAWLERGLRRDVLRVLAAHVRLEHGRQQAFQRPVVGVGHVGERLFRRYRPLEGIAGCGGLLSRSRRSQSGRTAARPLVRGGRAAGTGLGRRSSRGAVRAGSVVGAHAQAASGCSRACCQPNAPSAFPRRCPFAAPPCCPAGAVPGRPPAAAPRCPRGSAPAPCAMRAFSGVSTLSRLSWRGACLRRRPVNTTRAVPAT